MGKTVAITQARMTSTRLPGKVLKTVLGKTLLEYHLERASRAQTIDELVVATTVNATDEPIVELCRQVKIPFFRGSEHDVLSRYFQCAQAHQAQLVVRITSDCPLIDPSVIDLVVAELSSSPRKWDYVNNTGPTRTFPRGLDVEAFTFEALRQAHEQATQPAEREHVTLFMHQPGSDYRLGFVQHTPDLSHYRWTVDEAADFDVLAAMLEALYPDNPTFSLADCVAFAEQHPDVALANKHVHQKTH